MIVQPHYNHTDPPLLAGVCAICCSSDTNVQDKNEIIFCDRCDMAVHVFCYGQTRFSDEIQGDLEAVKKAKFVCDHCQLQPSRGTNKCILCRKAGGALRQNEKGEWFHVACVLADPALNFNIGAKASCAQPKALCPRKNNCVRCMRSSIKYPPGTPAKQSCSLMNCLHPDQGRRVVCCGCKEKACHVACAQGA